MGNYKNWNSQFHMYSESLEILKKMHEDSLVLMKNINSYFSKLAQEINDFTENSINPGGEGPNRRRTPSVQRLSNKFSRSESHNSKDQQSNSPPTPFNTIHLAQVCALKTSHMHLNEFTENNNKLFQEYHNKMNEIYTSAINAITSVEESKSFYEKAYKAYQDAGEQLKKAYDSGSSKLDEKKENFIEKQTKAVESHTHLNEVTAQTALLLESAMTQFEDQEQAKYEMFKQIIIGFGYWLEELAKNFDESSVQYEELLTNLPTIEQLNKLFDSHSIPNPKSDIQYQLIRVNPDLSIHLKASQFFKEEQVPGRTVYRVTEDFSGDGAEFLSVKKGHLVLSLEQRPPNVYVKDINECEGMIPLNILEIPTS